MLRPFFSGRCHKQDTVKQRLLLFITIFVQLTVIFMIAKCAFVLVNAELYKGIGFGGFMAVLWHGLPMDLSMSGYLTLLPGLLLAVSAPVVSRRWMGVISGALKSVLVVEALVIALAVSADAMLYPYWGFKLDTTPLFYFMSSPEAASASGGMGGGLAMTAILAVIFAVLLLIWTKFIPLTPVKGGIGARMRVLGVMLLCTGALFLPIRGGLTVSTMNLSRAYFSNDTRLNHAAVNPLFSFLYSASHQNDFDSQFGYFGLDEARAIVADMESKCVGDTVAAPVLSTERPDIYLVILESFSSHMLPSLGGAPVAMRLDSIAAQGVLFTQCYASSFRTDRALPAILSGYPGQPTTSIMKFVDKTDRLPSLPKSLKDAGYDLSYYYGGDINFTSMNAYLVSAGFDRIICDKDFPMTDRMSKWGAPDHLVFGRALSDMQAPGGDAPRFTVIQTSSSHEPFDVPYKSAFTDERLNAFAYADHSLGEWYDAMSLTPRWDRSLVVIIPDHFAVWPDTLTTQESRHHVPLVLAGGALRSAPARVDAVTAQTDIAATVLGMLGIAADDFPFSHNAFAPDAAHMAFFSDAEHASLAIPSGVATLNITSDTGEAGDSVQLRAVRAYLQTLYNDLQHR